MYALLFFLFSVANGQFICQTTYGEPINGFHLWQRSDTLSCFEDRIKCRKNEYVCVVGNSTPQMIDDAYLLKYTTFELSNNIRCNTSRNFWELKKINMDPMNKLTFVENDKNRYMDVYFGHGDVTISVSDVQILFIHASTNGRFRSNITILNNSFIKQIENFDFYWTRIHFTPVKTFHAGVWKIKLSGFPFEPIVTNLFYIDVKSILTCSDNILTTTCDVNIPTMTELSCHAGQAFDKIPLENIVCKIQNNELTGFNFNFRINSSEHEGHVITCISSSSNQIWTSNPIRYFQSIENTTKAMTISNPKKKNCQYSWITPAKEIIPSRRLNHYYMTLHGFGTYHGTITCGDECSYINRVVNFINPDLPTISPQILSKNESPPISPVIDPSILSIVKLLILNIVFNITLIGVIIFIAVAFSIYHVAVKLMEKQNVWRLL